MTIRAAFVVFSFVFGVAVLGATFTVKKYVHTHHQAERLTIRHAG
jgi:hypothetical protein